MRKSQTEALQAALVECQRFVRAAKKSLEVQNAHESYYPGTEAQYRAFTAATQRASMDLTRALARFRGA